MLGVGEVQNEVGDVAYPKTSLFDNGSASSLQIILYEHIVLVSSQLATKKRDL